MSSKREETQQRRRALHDELRTFAFEHLLRGSIVERRRRCGRPNCRCRTDPAARHPETYLSVRQEGRTVTLHLRPADEERVRRAVRGYQRLRGIITGLTECEVSDLQREARERVRSRKRRREGP